MGCGLCARNMPFNTLSHAVDVQGAYSEMWMRQLEANGEAEGEPKIKEV